MLEGIHVLNKTAIMTTYRPNENLFTTLTVIFFISFVLSLYGLTRDHWAFAVISIICLVSFLGVMILEFRSEEVPTDRYRYEVTIDDFVQFIDIYEKYDVIEQRGEIWVLEDKSKR